jgi:DNA-binding CsgD family transcriptional regulator/PAS domain-containing protein
MGARIPLLLQPCCPSVDDRRVDDFLVMVAALAGARWSVLEIVPRDAATGQTYERGEEDGSGVSLRLDVGDHYSAVLRIGGCPEPTAEVRSLLSTMLSSVLECSRLRDQSSLLRSALDSTSISVLLFDERGGILYANPPADQLLSLQTEDDLLVTCQYEPEQPLVRLLSTLVDRVIAGKAERPVWQDTLHFANGSSLACEVCLLPRRANLSDTVLVHLQPLGSEPAARVDAFAARHGLSPREQEVVQLLVDGLTTTAMAEQLGISPHTVRDHLKNLYRKTGSKSRSELLGSISRASSPVAATRT